MRARAAPLHASRALTAAVPPTPHPPFLCLLRRHHPRVVQFLGACTRQQPWLLLSEFLKGGSVASALQAREGRPLPPKLAGRWALDMAQALRYLHEHKPKG